MFLSTVAIPAFLLLTFIYVLSIFLRWNNHSKDARKRPPGPLALPIIGNMHLLGTLPHRNLQSLANKYGPVMSLWLGQVQAIVVSSPEAAELFLKTHDPAFASRPQNQATDYIFYGSQGMAFSEYGSYWRNMKKLCTLHPLSASKQELFGPLRREEVRMVVKSMGNAATVGEVVNVTEKVNTLLEDIVYKMILGRNRDDQFDLKGLVSKAMRLGGAFNLADFVPTLGAFDLQGITRQLKETSEALDEVLEKILKEHEQAFNERRGKQNDDLVDILLSLMHQPLNDDEQNFVITRHNIKGTALEIIFASFETTASTINWALSELLRDPRVMKKLQDELETVVGMDRMVEEADISKLNYLDMVVKETLRLFPAGIFIPRKSTRDIMVDGYYIRQNTRIMVNNWAIGRDVKTWTDDAHMFYPERFLNGNVDLQGNHFQLIPFGSGRRKCPGIQLGLTIVKMVIAQLVHCFNWELPCGMKPCDMDMTETFGFSMTRAKPLLAVPTHRIPSKVYDE
ncbi:cytochrome P450 CYP736A12-like [Neltuma alba]|uniref:cytochrome P450 CYP736A12-like n=1 Tax=Neltuma alba TaxID=207710 RepID=UPI0010A38D8F|nr:cytochrome P450 CYP736A12-like [Prosopis alba]